MDIRDLYYDYEQYLIGNADSIPRQHFVQGVSDKNKRVIHLLIKYVVNEIFHWSSRDAAFLLTKSVRDDFKLTPLINKYYPMPKYLDADEVTLYLVSGAFSDISFSLERHTLSVYTKVYYNRMRFPQQFFSASNTGLERARICMRYVVDTYMSFVSTKDLYGIFASDDSMTVLKNYRLDKACALYYSSPLDFLHHSISRSDDFLYDFFNFRKRCFSVT